MTESASNLEPASGLAADLAKSWFPLVVFVLSVLYLPASYLFDPSVRRAFGAILASMSVVTSVTVTVGLVQTRMDQRTLRIVRQYVLIVGSCLMLFAALYAAWASTPDAFTGAIGGAHASMMKTCVDSLYFSVTVFTTTGFGDIYAASTAMRFAVATQMLTGAFIVIVGFGVIVSSLAARALFTVERAGVPKILCSLSEVRTG